MHVPQAQAGVTFYRWNYGFYYTSASGCSWSHLGAPFQEGVHGYVWCHQSASGCCWSHLGAPFHVGVSACSRSHICVSGCSCRHVGVSDCRWCHISVSRLQLESKYVGASFYVAVTYVPQACRCLRIAVWSHYKCLRLQLESYVPPVRQSM